MKVVVIYLVMGFLNKNNANYNKTSIYVMYNIKKKYILIGDKGQDVTHIFVQNLNHSLKKHLRKPLLLYAKTTKQSILLHPVIKCTYFVNYNV